VYGWRSGPALSTARLYVAFRSRLPRFTRGEYGGPIVGPMDIVYIALILVVFGLVGLMAVGVDRL
jgi:hypothetical protein